MRRPKHRRRRLQRRRTEHHDAAVPGLRTRRDSGLRGLDGVRVAGPRRPSSSTTACSGSAVTRRRTRPMPARSPARSRARTTISTIRPWRWARRSSPQRAIADANLVWGELRPARAVSFPCPPEVGTAIAASGWMSIATRRTGATSCRLCSRDHRRRRSQGVKATASAQRRWWRTRPIVCGRGRFRTRGRARRRQVRRGTPTSRAYRWRRLHDDYTAAGCGRSWDRLQVRHQAMPHVGSRRDAAALTFATDPTNQIHGRSDRPGLGAAARTGGGYCRERGRLQRPVDRGRSSDPGGATMPAAPDFGDCTQPIRWRRGTEPRRQSTAAAHPGAHRSARARSPSPCSTPRCFSIGGRWELERVPAGQDARRAREARRARRS